MSEELVWPSREDDLAGLRFANTLGDVKRYSKRIEDDSARHSWMCAVVAELLFCYLEDRCPDKYKLDKLKVLRLLTFHDLPEAYTCQGGCDVDTNPSDKDRQKTKEEIEIQSMPAFLAKLPPMLMPLCENILIEYREQKTLESKFAHLVDLVQAECLVFDLKFMFKLWSESYFIQKRKKYFDAFPELLFIYEVTLQHHRDNGYFSQESE